MVNRKTRFVFRLASIRGAQEFPMAGTEGQDADSRSHIAMEFVTHRATVDNMEAYHYKKKMFQIMRHIMSASHTHQITMAQIRITLIRPM